MKARLAALAALALLATGCVGTSVAPPPQAPRQANVDMCPTPRPLVVQEWSREADGDGARVELIVMAREDEPRPLAGVTYELTWGDGRKASGALAERLAEGEWTLLDRDGFLGTGDRIVGRLPDADARWAIVLFDAEGAFLGGSPDCA